MSTVSFSANGREVKRAYDSIISGESTFEWALYGYEDGSNEIELVDSGSGLQQLCDEFDEEEYQYAFARVIDPNSKLPRFVFISWCGESVPFTKKGKYNTFTNDVLKYFSGFHIHINARSKFDVDPDEIMKKVKSCSGANYSFHQNQAVKNKFNAPKVEPKIEPKPQENQLQAFPSLPKRNPLNDNSNDSPKESDEKKPEKSLSRRSSCGYNPLEPNASRKNSIVRDTSRPSFSREISHCSFENIKEAFEKENSTNVCPGNISSKISAFQNQIQETNENNKKEQASKKELPFIEKKNIYNNTPPKQEKEEKSPEKSLSRRSSCGYNPLEPNASRRNSVSNGIGFEESELKTCPGNISSKISAFQNQIEETNENNKREQAIKKELSSRNMKIWNQNINDIKEEPETRSTESINTHPLPVEVEKVIPEPQPEIKRSVPEPKSNDKQGNTAKALYSYEAAEEGELSFEENEIITNIVDIPGEGWWSGNNSKGEYGMFPSNYVEECNNNDNDGGKEVVVEEKSQKPVVENSEKNISAKVLYSYEAQDDTEIDLEEGEIITGIILQDEDWAIGFNQKSKQGMFPLNYVELIQ